MKNNFLLALIICALSPVVNAMESASSLPEDRVGYIFASNGARFTAVMLNSQYVVSTAHRSNFYESDVDQVFIKADQFSLTISKDSETGDHFPDFQSILAQLIMQSIPFSRYDVIRLPQKVAHQLKEEIINIDDHEAIEGLTRKLFELQENTLELLKEDKGIDGFTYPEGDWTILELKTKIPVQPLAIQNFSPVNLSGKKSVCFGLKTKLDFSQASPVMRISRKKIDVNPEYYSARKLFFSSIPTFGAQDDTGLPVPLPESSVTDGMGGGPLFIQCGTNDWVLGAVLSTNLCDRKLPELRKIDKELRKRDKELRQMAEQIAKESQQESEELAKELDLDFLARKKLTDIVEFYSDKLYPVHTLYASLEELYVTCQELNIL